MKLLKYPGFDSREVKNQKINKRKLPVFTLLPFSKN